MRLDTTVGLTAVVLGIIYTVQTLGIPKASIGNPMAPLYFPLSLGVLMIGMGASLAVNSVTRPKPGGKPAGAAKKPPVDIGAVKLIVGTSVMCLCYAFLFDEVGYSISTLLFLGGMLYLVNGRKGWLGNAVITAGFTFGIWYAFEKILKVSLP